MLSLITLEAVAAVFQVAAGVAALLLIPYSAIALVLCEWHPKIRAVRAHPDAYLRPSLKYMTWLASAHLCGMAYLMCVYALRVYLGHEVTAEQMMPQPIWSYSLSMVSTLILLILLSLPSTFLYVVKRRIVESEHRNITTPH